MKKYKRIKWGCGLLLVFLLANIKVKGQQQCGTRFNSPQEIQAWQLNHQQFLNFQNLGMQVATDYKYIPVFFHIVRQSNSSGGISLTDARLALERCNNAYSNTLIRFYECEHDYIDNDTYYDFNQATEEAGLVSTRLVAGAANVFIVNSITTPLGGACGYANFPGSVITGYANNFILMQISCMNSASQTSLQHEFGHFFSLPHTHETAFGSELVTRGPGANCTTAGDLCCDTPADPGLSQSNVNSSCQYTGSATDANGQAYTPDPANIMSYSLKQCRTYFSPQQIAKINFTVSVSGSTDRNSLSCTNCLNVSAYVPFSNGGILQMTEYYLDELPYANGKFVIAHMQSFTDFGTANVSGQSIKLAATQDIVLSPGFSFDAGLPQLAEFTAGIDACGGTGNKIGNISEYHTSNILNNSIKVFPNPFQNNLHLVINLIEEANVTVIIYDLMGKEVDHVMQNQIKQKGLVQMQYNGEKLAPGIYFCNININGKRFTEKIVKM